MSNDLHFAILAPVPLEHLQTGLEVCTKEGSVAFGTRKWEFFRNLDQMRDGLPVAALIYPSHDEDAPAKDTFIVCWFGWYVRSVDSKGGAHPDGMKYRPPTTAYPLADNKGHWATFWHVEGLRELPANKQIPIGKLQGFKGGWRKNAPPRGPELVTLPELLSYEP
ncbi:hypothetical protein [Methyloceanibacter sp.]|uniref:hypothetical protein n=1 Tax=Methyloceanibacter sp. TaxID=1965321 RepID=UPI002D7076A0|nr:hypothetical protein [Methyloceanibacter sp.]HZP09753.1 hypothetical protein [Methyloceanibacter sp.]